MVSWRPVLCALVLTAACPAGAAEQAFALPAHVPQSAPLCVVWFPGPDAQPLTGLHRFLQDPGVRSAWAPARAQLQALDAVSAIWTGVSMRKLLAQAPGPAGAALLEPGPNGAPRVVVHVRLGAQAPRLAAALPRIEEALLEMADDAQPTEPPGGADTGALVFDGRPVAWTVRGEDLVIGIGPDTFPMLDEDALDPEAAASLSTLAGTDLYARARGSLDPERGGWLTFVRVRRGERAQGLGTIGRAALACTPHKHGYRTTVFLEDSNPAPEPTRMLHADSASARHARYVPAEATGFATARVRLPRLWLALRGGLEALSADQGEPAQEVGALLRAIDAFEETARFEFTELFAALGPECSIASGPSGLYAFADVRDRKALEAYLARVDACLDEARSRSLVYRGHTIRYWNQFDGPLPVAPAYCFVDEHTVLVGGQVLTVKSVLARLDGPDFTPLPQADEFARLTAEVPEGAMLVYAPDARPVVDGYEVALAMVQSALALDPNLFDAGTLPALGTVLTDVDGGGLAATLRRTDAGLELTWYGPFGVWDALTPALATAAALTEGPLGLPVAAAVLSPDADPDLTLPQTPVPALEPVRPEAVR